MFRFFINNPIFSSVIAIIIIICGLTAIPILPLAEYPDITPPTLTINAHYPGATAKVIEQTVASPIEDQINGASGMIYMNSTANNGEYNLTITFATGTDLNSVIGDVLNRLNSALPILPSIVQNLGVNLRKSSQNLLMSVAILNDGRYDDVYLSNYAYRSIYTELSRIKGVGDIAIIGARTYSMRIWLQPDKMVKLGITVDNIKNAIKDQNIQTAVGSTGDEPTYGHGSLTFDITGSNYYSSAKEFENIILRVDDNSYIRIKDIARVELGAQSYDTISKLDEKNSVGLQIYLSASANSLTVHKEVVDKLTKLSKQFPDGISYKISFDNTKFISQALKNVARTLFDACVLVILVVFLFLQKGRATIIPIITIPVALIGTFAGMLVTGFSINNLTLFGLILSIGIVVDDSIVVIENVERLMRERNLSAHEASIETMKEVSTALIAIVLVLCCAFIPSAFLGGLTGILYRQFAITISMAVVISGIVALTLTPALCAILLNSSQDFETKNKFFNKFNDYFDRFTNYYIKVVKYMLMHKIKFIILFAILIMITIATYLYLPRGFIPNEDKGFFTTQITLPSNFSLQQTQKVTQKYIEYLAKQKQIDNNTSLIGVDSLNVGSNKPSVATVISSLKDWSLRKKDVNELVNMANSYGTTQKDANFVAYNSPPIDGLSNNNGIEFYIEDKVEGDYNKLQQVLVKLISNLKQNKEVANAYFNFNAQNTQVKIVANVEKTKFYGLNVSDVYNSLAANYGINLVNYFYKMGSLYWVILQSDSNYRLNPFQLNNLFVQNNKGVMIPLSVVTTTEFINAPDVIERFNDYLAAKVVVIPESNYTIQNVMDIINKSVVSLPSNYGYSWYGISSQQQNVNNSSTLAFIFGVIMIFLVLAGQFEMWRLPLVVIMGIPLALLGAGITLLLRGLNNDLYFQISLITLLGLSAKNSILITEFAIEYYREGMNTLDAVVLAAKHRFRPIIMTSFAFILGAIPLAFATGANSNAEHSIGTGIVGGMLGATFITTIFTPLFFVLIMGKKNIKKE